MSRNRLLTLLLASVLIPGTVAAQSYHFTPQLGRNDRLDLSNVNGDIIVDRSSGSTTDVTVDKVVKRGNGDLVSVVMEKGSNEVHICTVFLSSASDHGACGESHHDRGDHNEVEVTYHVHLAAGVGLDAGTVNGSVKATGIDAANGLHSVNGNVDYSGAPPASIGTVNGTVTATLTRGTWNGRMTVETVNGDINLTFPADLSASLNGSSVNGGVSSDFPVTIQGKWGPRSFSGKIGNGNAELHVTTVNGSIGLHKS